MKTIKKKMAILALLLLPTVMAWAGNVSETDAMKKAQQFLDKRGTGGAIQMKAAARGPRRAAPTAVQSDYYVFNVGSGDGFVIVSGDDRTTDILGYADSGRFDEENMPDGLRYLLDGYAEQMAWLDAHQAEVSAAPAAISPARSPIAPLIESRWDQGAPYNNLCPEIDDEKTVTGCVATSMAQLMYYHKWPTAACTDIPGYTTNTKNKNEASYSLSVSGLTSTSFNWGAMTNTYASNATGAAADEVAKLMKYCGVSLQMTYGLRQNGGSGAFSEAIPFALKTYFGYDGGVRHTYRKCYSYTEWVDLIYSELASRRPVALHGQSMGGGHSFVCDGYDTDDYFHINWGWGGDGNGYFRLSVLQPYVQGAGGSSTLDGFSFSQGAVIGIQPPVDGNKDYCLSLEGLRFGSSDASASKNFTRENKTDNFTGISLYYVVYDYYYGSNAFDYAVQLVDANGDIVQSFHTEENVQMSWNQTNTEPNNTNSKGRTLSGLSIPSSVDDGTYYIKVMSRPAGTSNWQECYDGDRYQLTAVISDNSLTITVPIPATINPASATLDVSGNLTQGYEQEVTATITGGSIDFHDDVILRVNGKSVMGKVLDVPAGRSVVARFVYTPLTAGDNVLTLWSRSTNSQIGSSTTVSITESDATSNLTLTVNYTIGNLSDGKLYGNALRVTVRANNPSTENTYVGRLNCSLREYASADANIDDYVSNYVTKYIVIEKDSYTDVGFDYMELEVGKFYRLRFSYSQNYIDDGKMKTRLVAFDPTEPYEMIEGYKTYNADGTTTILSKPVNNAINGGTALCIDLTGLTTIPTITPSSNTNCVYLLPDGVEVPASLSGCNVVCGSTANNLTLTDGEDFFTPIAFTAENASYTRTFTLAAAGTSGWNTLFLPFTATTVSCVGLGDVDWFQSAGDTDGNFWLRSFTGDGEGSVTFDYANTTSIAANTPYIIAVPGSDFGSWQMTGKEVTFSGTNVSIAATSPVSGVSGNHYKFVGSTVGTTVSNVYVLNDKGSKFVKTTDKEVEPFRAWFTPISISSLSRPSLVIFSPEETGIELPSAEGEESGCYFTLDGRRLPAAPSVPGIYVLNRKKVIVK